MKAGGLLTASSRSSLGGEERESREPRPLGAQSTATRQARLGSQKPCHRTGTRLPSRTLQGSTHR